MYKIRKCIFNRELDCIKFNSIVLNGKKMRKRIILRSEYVYKYGLRKKKFFLLYNVFVVCVL